MRNTNRLVTEAEGEGTMKVKGQWSTRTVWVEGKKLDPIHSQKIRNHSPDGFNWGYGGSGPAQLALALVLLVTADDETALRHYQDFKWRVIAQLPQADFEVEIDPHEWKLVE